MAKQVDTPPSSSKIPKNIKSIIFSGKKTLWTSIKFASMFQPDNQNDIVTETPTFKSDMSRHGDFDRSMDKFKVHLMVRCGFAEPIDRLGKPIDRTYMNEFLYEDDPRFSDVEITGIIITSKKDLTGFQILGTAYTVDGQQVKLKSPAISTLKKAEGEGYNYPLQTIADEDLDNVLLEALSFMQYKSANNQLKLAV